MNTFITLIARGWLVLLLAPLLSQAQDLGQATAQALQQRYEDTRMNCGSPSTPAFLCTGVMIRATTASSGQPAWNPALPNNYGVSFSFLRRDAAFSALAGNASNGFIFFPVLDTPVDKLRLEVLCAFPVSANSEQRAEAGCGQHPAYPGSSDLCHRNDITTAAEWLGHYYALDITHRDQHQCAFSTRDADNQYASENFSQSLRAHVLLATLRFNELRVRTWPQDVAAALPVQAFFYLQGSGSGRTQAMNDQRRFKLDSQGMVKPVIRLTLPSSVSTPAVFSYLVEDQTEAIVPDPPPAPYPRQVTRQCARYTENAQWVNREGGISLSITPTACARNHIPAAERAFAVDELFERWSSDPRFTNPHGMRDQFLCHLVNAPDKDEWNIEPWRPDVGMAITEAAYCNP